MEFQRPFLEEAEKYIKQLEKIGRFEEKYHLPPLQEASKLCESMYSFVQKLPEIITPLNPEELLTSEVKRRIASEAAYLEQRLSGRMYHFDMVTQILNIPQEDITSLHPWLKENKEKTLRAIERLFQSRDIEEHELPLRADIPPIRRQAEEFATTHIQRYHSILGKLLEGLTKAGSYLRDVHAVPTSNERSYFDPRTKTFALAIPQICFLTEDRTLHIRESELVRLYGHEGMGHALQHIMTENNHLPCFLKKSSAATIASEESLTQFYEGIIFEDLKKSPSTQKKLGIEHKFDEIYQEVKDTEQLSNYKRKLFQYAIVVLADKSFGKPDDPETTRKKIACMNEVAFNPRYGLSFMEEHRQHFDSQGNLYADLVSELRYCAQPVRRSLDIFQEKGISYENEGRDLIDATFLRGFWTPIGFVENARWVAEQNKKC